MSVPVSHLDMFFETRSSLYVSDSDPCNSANTELKSVPTDAEIRFENGTTRNISAEKFEAPNGKGYETAMFLIERAILDPDAVVVPNAV